MCALDGESFKIFRAFPKSEMAASRFFSFESLQSHWLNKG